MAKDLDIKIEEAHERVLRRIGEVFGQRTVIGMVCPVNKFDARYFNVCIDLWDRFVSYDEIMERKTKFSPAVTDFEKYYRI